MLSELAGKENVLCILSKKDRPALCDKNRLKQAFHQVTEVSSVTGQGTGQLLEQLRERLRMEEFHPEDGMIANERQLASARQAADCCRRALEALEVDYMGLDNVDRRMLTSIIENYGGGPVGLETLAATINEEAVTLEDVYEPYLLQTGFLTRTPRGRCVTKKAYDHLHIPFFGQQSLE